MIGMYVQIYVTVHRYLLVLIYLTEITYNSYLLVFDNLEFTINYFLQCSRKLDYGKIETKFVEIAWDTK